MYKKFNTLNENARRIRERVFMEEQGFANEFDEIDESAVHLVFYEDGIPTATCRYFKGEEELEYVVGRIAVLPEYRKNHMGSRMMSFLEENIKAEGGKKISLSAQCRVVPFYEKNGYQVIGEPYLDEHCEHVHMEKEL